MPRKLRKEKQRTALSLDSFSIPEILAFTAAWSPPVNEADRRQFPRWETWADYFRDFDLIRDELLASPFHSRHLAGAAPFADTVRAALAAAAPGEVWEKHVHSALQHSHIYQHGDGHIHEGEARLGAAVEIEVNA